MKNGKKANQGQRNYAFRRVLWDMLVAAKAVSEFSNTGRDYSKKETLKAASLLMTRNLDSFFFDTKHGHDDDINVTDFDLRGWTPERKAKLTKACRRRINKLVGHVVASRPDPFTDAEEVKRIVVPLIREGYEFLCQCLSQKRASYTGKASWYRRRLNGILPRIGLAKLPKQ